MDSFEYFIIDSVSLFEVHTKKGEANTSPFFVCTVSQNIRQYGTFENSFSKKKSH